MHDIKKKHHRLHKISVSWVSTFHAIISLVRNEECFKDRRTTNLTLDMFICTFLHMHAIVYVIETSRHICSNPTTMFIFKGCWLIAKKSLLHSHNTTSNRSIKHDIHFSRPFDHSKNRIS